MKNPVNYTILRDAFFVFLVVLLAYGYFSSERDVNINSRLALVKAFVDEGQLEIDSYHNTELYTVDKAFFNGHYYSDKAIGTSVLGIAAYYPVRWAYYQLGERLTPRLFREWMTFLAVSLPAALLAPFIYILASEMRKNRLAAWLMTLAISLGTPLYKYSTAFYGHALAAVFYFLAFFIWFHAKRNGKISLPIIFISAVLLGLTVITEYPTALLVLLLSFYILHVLLHLKLALNWKIYSLMALGFLLPISLQLAYNYSIFGSFFTTGYSHEANVKFQAAHAADFMGIGMPDLRVLFYQTLHPSLGVFWQSPVLILAVSGFFFMARRKEYRAELAFIGSTALLFTLLISGYYMWWGGVALTPRHLIPILPLFALPLIFLPNQFTWALLGTTLLSIFQNLIMTASGYTGLYEYFKTLISGKYIVEYTGMLIYKICLPNVLTGDLMNNRGLQWAGLQGWVSLVPLLIAEGLLFLAYSLRGKR